MRSVRLGGANFFGEYTVRQFRRNASPGGWFPALRSLRWIISETHLPYVDLFFSPQLVSVWIYASQAWSNSGFPRDIMPALASTISALPTSTLQTLSIGSAFEAGRSDTP